MMRRIGAGLAVIALHACSPVAGTGADGGGDSSATSGTIGNQCTRMYTAFCTHAINDCLIGYPSLSGCVADGLTACCSDRCANAAITPNATVDVCVQALAAEGCNEAAQRLNPPQCIGVPRVQ